MTRRRTCLENFYTPHPSWACVQAQGDNIPNPFIPLYLVIAVCLFLWSNIIMTVPSILLANALCDSAADLGDIEEAFGHHCNAGETWVRVRIVLPRRASPSFWWYQQPCPIPSQEDRLFPRRLDLPRLWHLNVATNAQAWLPQASLPMLLAGALEFLLSPLGIFFVWPWSIMAK